MGTNEKSLKVCAIRGPLESEMEVLKSALNALEGKKLSRLISKRALPGYQNQNTSKLLGAFLHRARLHCIAIQMAMAFGLPQTATKHYEAATYLLRHLNRLLNKGLKSQNTHDYRSERPRLLIGEIGETTRGDELL